MMCSSSLGPVASGRCSFIRGCSTSSVMVAVDSIPSQHSSTQGIPETRTGLMSRSDVPPPISLIRDRFASRPGRRGSCSMVC